MQSTSLPIRQSSLTLQQRLMQLVGARLTTFINPFGLVENAKILKVLKSVIVVKQKGSILLLSPSGLQVISIDQRVQGSNAKRFGIGLNSIAQEGGPNVATILNNRRIIRIGSDFLETTVNGTIIELIPLTNVTVIFPIKNHSRKTRSRK